MMLILYLDGVINQLLTGGPHPVALCFSIEALSPEESYRILLTKWLPSSVEGQRKVPKKGGSPYSAKWRFLTKCDCCGGCFYTLCRLSNMQ